MEPKVMQMSPLAVAEAENPTPVVNTVGEVKYPFKDIEAGMCFTLELDKANLKSLRTLASRNSKDGKKFIVIVHDDKNIVEVARIR